MNTGATLADRHPGWNKFPLRGIFALVDSLLIGIRALSISARVSLEGKEETGADEEERKVEEKKLGSG